MHVVPKDAASAPSKQNNPVALISLSSVFPFRALFATLFFRSSQQPGNVGFWEPAFRCIRRMGFTTPTKRLISKVMRIAGISSRLRSHNQIKICRLAQLPPFSWHSSAFLLNCYLLELELPADGVAAGAGVGGASLINMAQRGNA